MSDSNSNENNQPSIPSHNEDSAPPADSQDQGVLDTVKSQINSTGNSLVELGNKTSAMAGESFNEVKNKAGSISPGEVYNNVREQVQSTTSGGNGNQQDEEPTEHHDPDESKDHEHIDNMEREKIMEFLQEKYKSTANMRSGK